eukprot:12011399-Alexandrium_andersonii.AAC.1
MWPFSVALLVEEQQLRSHAHHVHLVLLLGSDGSPLPDRAIEQQPCRCFAPFCENAEMERM